MPKALFTAEEFTPTQWSTSQDKATFGNHFFRFIESEWKPTLFTRGFYNRLSNCFGHIAHYDLHGFYGTWFAEDAFRLNFLRHTLRFGCYGDPEYTFSDVERAIKAAPEGTRPRTLKHSVLTVPLRELRGASRLLHRRAPVIGFDER